MPYIIPIVIGVMFYLLSIIVHVLVIRKNISYTLVNGGRSPSYEAQAKTSMVSIIVLVIGLSILILYYIFPQISTSLVGMILMAILTLYWTLGFLMQLLGTWLEKRIISIILFLGVVSHLMIMLEYF